MVEINYTCSLGSLCHSSQILKRTNYKFYSYPFDWIFSDCDIITHCIEDNFNIFLDKSYYIHVSDTQCGHSKYNNKMFAHCNPLIHIEHYDYYIRCVDRFKQLLQKPEHKLFIMTYVNMSMDDISVIKNKIMEFNDTFSKYTSNYTLLCVLNIQTRQNNHIFTYHDNIHFLELHTTSKSGGIEFGNKNDNIYLDTIIKSNYQFSIKELL